MDKNEFLKAFADQFDETDPADIQLSTPFKSIEEWSSMVALMVIAMVDDNYSKKVTGADLKNANTVEDLFAVIESK